MKARAGAVGWFITGGVIGFSALDTIGIGGLTLLPALCVGVLLLVFRVPGVWTSLVGAGAVVALLWTLHITSGDTPDSELWPVVVGLALVVAGLYMSLRRHGRPGTPGMAPADEVD